MKQAKVALAAGRMLPAPLASPVGFPSKEDVSDRDLVLLYT